MFENFNLSTPLQKYFTYSKTSVLSIIVLSLIFSSLLWIGTKHYYENLAKEEFEIAVLEKIDNIDRHMSRYENVIRSGIGLFHASDNVTREDWFYFIETMNIKQRYPGIQGLGFSLMLKSDEITAIEQKMRNDGFSSFSLKPVGTRKQYSTILYLEPMDKRNIQAIGYDMYSESTRRAAMQKARDSGHATISKKVTLVQEIDSDVQAGMLIYLPLYKRESKIDTIQERRKALVGFVYAAFRMNDLMNTIGSKKSISNFEIYDSSDMTEESLMYRSFVPSSYVAKYHTKKILTVSNHSWYIKFSSTPEFDNSKDNQYPLLLTLFWLAVYFVLLYIILTLIKSRHLLQSQANELRKLSQVVEQSPNGIFITNLNNEIEYTNASFTRITGYTKLEVLGKNPCRLKSDKIPITVYEEMFKVLNQGENWYGEFINKRKNATEYTESIIASPIVQNDEQVSNYVVIVEDITHSKELENDLIKAKEGAEKANKAKSDFLANMSHEIRTPLNGILGLIDLVLKSNLTEQQRDYLNKSKTSSKALLHVINDILDYSKIEAGKLNLENTVFELDSVISNVKDLFEHQANIKGLSFNIRINKRLTLIGDPLRLTQILTNIIGNAIKFTDEGNIDVSVELLKEDKHYKKLKFIIKDSGMGMSQKVQENLFLEFSQADNSITRKYGGSGLGLAISKQLVKLMSGDIWVQSRLGEGSEFIFTATFGKFEDKENSIEFQNIRHAKEQRNALDTTSLIGSRILLVEDNKINQIVAVGVLEELDLHVDIANNGKEAVEMIEAGKEYDLILMDLQMPIMDGFEASRRIKKINANIPIVALSAAVMKEDVLKAAEAQMSAHLAKPIDHDELVATLLKYIKSKKSYPQDLKLKENKENIDDYSTEFYGVDSQELKNRIGDKPKIIKQLISKFCEDYKDAEKIFDISKIGTDEFNRSIHSLKGVSGNISLKKIFKISDEIHKTIDIQVKKNLIPELIKEVSVTVENLKSQLKLLQDNVASDEYKKDDVLDYLREIQEDIKHFRAISQERIELLEKMLSVHVQMSTIKELTAQLLAYKYKDAANMLNDIYKLLVD